MEKTRKEMLLEIKEELDDEEFGKSWYSWLLGQNKKEVETAHYNIFNSIPMGDIMRRVF